MHVPYWLGFFILFTHRYDQTATPDDGQVGKVIIPTPVSYVALGTGSVNLNTGGWVVVYLNDEVFSEAQFLAG